MNTSIRSLAIAVLAMAAGPYGTLSSQPLDHSTTGIVDIVVNGVPQRHYAHEGRWYVEAITGREYAIRLRNPYGVRVAVALSVDGLNTIDARHTTAADARKWVIEPYQTIMISGWQVNSAEARRFEFTTEARSYAQALGQTANLGIISAAFFKERTAAVASAPQADAAAEARSSAGMRSADQSAATGMGRRTGHAVTQVWLDLEHTASDVVNIRYEFRPQLVKLGILPATPMADPLERRGRARGFEGEFSPEVGIAPQRR